MLETFALQRCYNKGMAYLKGHISTERNTSSVGRRNPPSKRPIQVSKELHALISMMATDGNQSLEQIVSKAVIKEAKAALDAPNDEKQRRYYTTIKSAEDEIKQRYIEAQSKRSAQMRCINSQKRKKSATPTSSFSRPPRPVSSYNNYPVEYRYGFAIPKPPPSSYPTYSSPS